MEDLGFIVISYLLSLGATAVMVVWILRRGKSVAKQVSNEDKPWI